jgi:hypothetical protein
MQDINILKQQEVVDTPLFVFECRMPSGAIQRWSTHRVTLDGETYSARVLSHNLFELKSSLDDGADAAAKLGLILANSDSYCSQIEWNEGFKGSQLTVSFVFYDLRNGTAVTEPRVVFRGVGGPPDEITESTFRVTFANRLNLQRVLLPEIRIQRRCPWSFPGTAAQRAEALGGSSNGRYSPFERCGYSAGETGGIGNLMADGSPFVSCDYTRAQCEERGMFDADSAGTRTRRFGGIEFVPATVLVRSYGEKGTHASPVFENEARYNDFVPLLYGTAWYQPPIVFARNDGNLTRLEVLLGAGEIERVVKVVVNDVEIPEALDGSNMTGTGWFKLVTRGARSGAFNLDFTDAAGNALGDPYGSMAMMSVAVPNRISSGSSLPRIQVLAQGLRLERFDSNGAPAGAAFTNNPAWVLLDVLRRSGWSLDDLDISSFAATAAYCDELIPTKDLHGNDTTIPRYQCNLVVRRRRSAADLVRGIRNGAGVILVPGADGRIVLRPESSLAAQQSEKPATTNSPEALNGGWPAYEFSDGSATYSGLLRKPSGEPHIRFWSRSTSETPNRLTVEFQDEFNEYQQDSLSLVDIDDVELMGQEITASVTALGLPNFDQAARILRRQLNKGVAGNLYVEFATSVRGFGLVPGDIITITYEKEGLQRQPFRIVRIAPSVNFRTAIITAQYHDDDWYSASGLPTHSGRRQPGYGLGIPRPLLGDMVGEDGRPCYSVQESVRETSDGGYSVGLSVGFAAPGKPGKSAAGVPILSLSPVVDDSTGSLRSGQTLYYAVAGVDAQGNEGPLSFTVRATIATTSDTNSVRLNALSFSSGTVSFRVYRGLNPSQLVRIASDVAISSTFVDDGASAEEAEGPPDLNYDHANFYWRLELQPEVPANLSSPNTIGNDGLHMLANENRGMLVRITGGRGNGQERTVVANDGQVLTVSPKWEIQPDATSLFVIAEPSWRFGALTVQGPAEFDVPNRRDATVHILGRSANVHDQECAEELSMLTRWRIGGAGVAVDADIPPAPIFGLVPAGKGTVELAGVGFEDLANTRTISAGTLTLFYSDEIAPPPSLRLSAGIDAEAVEIQLTTVLQARTGDVLQIDAEVMTLEEIAPDGASATVTRGTFGCAASDHQAGATVYVLSRRVYVVPFVRDFFGSPASGSFSFPIYLPDVRIAAASLFVTNDRGDSPTSRISFMSLADVGIRTLSGGQFSMQVNGPLALQTDATPPLLVEDTHAVRDIFAMLGEPAAGDVRLRLRQDDDNYCEIAIPGGATRVIVNGFGLPALRAKSQLSLDIVGVPQAADAFPGADLSVTLRM